MFLICSGIYIFSQHDQKHGFLPEASFGLRVWSLPASVCLCVRVSVCVCQTRACPHDNSPLVQARITKFGTKVQKTLVKVPIVFEDDRPWPSRSNLPKNQILPHFELVRLITQQPFMLESPNLDRKCILALSRCPLILDKIEFDLHLHF